MTDSKELIKRLRELSHGYAEIGVHELVEEAGGGWSLDSDIDIGLRGGACLKFHDADPYKLIKDYRQELAEALDRLNAKGGGYVILQVPVEYEEDEYDSSHGPSRLVSSGGPYFNFGAARLVAFDDPIRDPISSAADTLEANAKEIQELREMKEAAEIPSGGS